MKHPVCREHAVLDGDEQIVQPFRREQPGEVTVEPSFSRFPTILFLIPNR